MTEQDHISRKRVVYSIRGAEDVVVHRDVEYRRSADERLTLDVYYPPQAKDRDRFGAVVFVTGFRDRGAEKMFGCKFKEMGSYISWAQLVAASGMVAVTYTNDDVEADAAAVFGFVRERSGDLQIDPERVGVWSCSGHGPNALALLSTTTARCAALLYPYTLDTEGSAAVATAAAHFRFVNASAGKRIADLSSDIPIFLARAGRDQMPGLNDAFDRFAAGALAANLPVSIVNHATGPHAFDLHDDSRTTHAIVRQTLEFLRFHLSP
jgi:hypothetical protein